MQHTHLEKSKEQHQQEQADATMTKFTEDHEAQKQVTNNPRNTTAMQHTHVEKFKEQYQLVQDATVTKFVEYHEAHKQVTPCLKKIFISKKVNKMPYCVLEVITKDKEVISRVSCSLQDIRRVKKKSVIAKFIITRGLQ